MKRILVVGAGLSGATLARTLAEAGRHVELIDKRSHLAGNAYDNVNELHERIHMYGPHLLHGDRGSEAIKWLSRFTEWIPYEHRVKAKLPDGRYTPLPVNRTTLEDVFRLNLNSDVDAKNFLETKAIKLEPKNTDELFLSTVGEELTNLFFRPYTRKMWAVDPSELEISIGARLPVRTSRDDRYFNDTFQALPVNGYTSMVANILEHKNICVNLSTEFSMAMIKHYDEVFASISIDQLLDYKLGPLPYRSIKFHHIVTSDFQPSAVINYTDNNKYTRSTQWSLFPNSPSHGSASSSFTITFEEPCRPEDNNNELYYPVRNAKSLATYQKYLDMAEEIYPSLTLIGRTGLFKYLDMVPAVTIHLQMAKRYLSNA